MGMLWLFITERDDTSFDVSQLDSNSLGNLDGMTFNHNSYMIQPAKFPLEDSALLKGSYFLFHVEYFKAFLVGVN